MQERVQWSRKLLRIIRSPDTHLLPTDLKFYFSSQQQSCIVFDSIVEACETQPVTTCVCRSGYLRSDTLVSMGMTTSDLSLSSSQSRLLPSSSLSASSSGFSLLSMSDAEEAQISGLPAAACFSTQVFGCSAGVELQGSGWSSLSPEKNLFFVCGKKMSPIDPLTTSYSIFF